MVYPLFFVRTTRIPYWSPTPVIFIFIQNIVNCHPLLITILIYNIIRICIILSLIVANVIVYAMKPNMYSSVTKNILLHKIQFYYVLLLNIIGWSLVTLKPAPIHHARSVVDPEISGG